MENHNFLIQADRMHALATRVLEHIHIHSFAEKIGVLYFTGSYALNMMTWNDIDMQLVIKNDVTPCAALLQMLEVFIAQKSFIKAKILHFAGDYKPHWPRGYALSIKMHIPDLGGVWKFDIWILDSDDFEKNQRLLKELKKALTPQTRELILTIKHELMQKTGRVPKMGSHWLYQGILLHKLTDKIEILNFLRAKGVVLEQD